MRKFIFSLLPLVGLIAKAAPVFLDDQFEMPEGFRIYRAAEKELTGGSYALRFDGQGRLLVGDGTALRRLIDKDADGVFDGFEVIATGLGWRGPQGILVYGDRLFAVGGDGIQLYEGYSSGGPLRHVGRIGAKLNTGGDHDSHTLLRGHDGYIYFIAGNGSGLKDRLHITAANSPVMEEREASVFRISPDGKDWECVAAGGRNPPSLGMNYLGDLFSFDSDMEWHVGLPWYRPARLSHWVIGGDQGWQEVGAYPPYYIDNLPGILDVGRGSPNWGVFYEHVQLPPKYKNAFLVCDYRWKAESTDDYRTSGRLVAFHLERSGSRWKAAMETLVRPKADAKDTQGRAIPFALVDVDVAPDGSIYVTEHNQGVWRILYDPKKSHVGAPKLVKAEASGAINELMTLPQPGAEWSRLEEARLLAQIGNTAADQLVAFARASNVALEKRLQAIRLVAPQFPKLELAKYLWTENAPEIRAQAAWLAGLRGGEDLEIVRKLLKDSDAFVRRRAAEALTRHMSLRFLADIETLLNDPDRTVRYVSMICLAHLPTETWFSQVAKNTNANVRLAALTAAKLRTESTPSAPDVLKSLFSVTGREAQLDLLRAVNLYANEIDPEQVVWWETNDPDVTWEQARLLGVFASPKTYSRLHAMFVDEKDNVRKFHFFQQIAKFKSGWTPQQEKQAMDWILTTQQGWFAEFNAKGVEFPIFLQSSMEEFALHHPEAVLAAADRIQMESLPGSAWLGMIADREPSRIFALYGEAKSEARQIKLLQAMGKVRTAETGAFLRKELGRIEAPAVRKTAINSLKAMPRVPENEPFLREAVVANKPERADAEIHKTIMDANIENGDATRGRRVYERILCNTCHGGGQTPGQEGRIFGPDLAGVTARLTRAELADSMVYPSKLVADRFKAVALTLKDGTELTGFVTERTADHVTFADAVTVQRIAANEIEKMAPQEKSLMPEGLLRTLSDQEITNLLKFISTLGQAPGRN